VELYRVNLPAPFGDDWNGGLAAPTLANIDGDPDLELVAGTTDSGVVAYDLPNTANAASSGGRGAEGIAAPASRTRRSASRRPIAP
jgi:hypothetical protein